MNDVSTKYEDIINTEWPRKENSIDHPKMSLSNRAKIFLPFAALKGFEEELEKRRQKYLSKDESKNEFHFEQIEN